MLLTMSSRTGATPRQTTVATLTPVATTATKKSSWEAAISTPTTATRRHWWRASDQDVPSRPVTTARTRSTATAAIAR